MCPGGGDPFENGLGLVLGERLPALGGHRFPRDLVGDLPPESQIELGGVVDPELLEIDVAFGFLGVVAAEQEDDDPRKQGKAAGGHGAPRVRPREPLSFAATEIAGSGLGSFAAPFLLRDGNFAPAR